MGSDFSRRVGVWHSCAPQAGPRRSGLRLSAEVADEGPQGQVSLGDIYRCQCIRISQRGCLEDGRFAQPNRAAHASPSRHTGHRAMRGLCGRLRGLLRLLKPPPWHCPVPPGSEAGGDPRPGSRSAAPVQEGVARGRPACTAVSEPRRRIGVGCEQPLLPNKGRTVPRGASARSPHSRGRRAAPCYF